MDQTIFMPLKHKQKKDKAIPVYMHIQFPITESKL